jgi:hypothetical protein
VIIFFIAGLLILRLERVNDWGAYRIPGETGLLISSVAVEKLGFLNPAKIAMR